MKLKTINHRRAQRKQIGGGMYIAGIIVLYSIIFYVIDKALHHLKVTLHIP